MVRERRKISCTKKTGNERKNWQKISYAFTERCLWLNGKGLKGKPSSLKNHLSDFKEAVEYLYLKSSDVPIKVLG